MASTTAAAHERCESVKVNVTSSAEAAGSGGDEDVACSVAVLDEDVACSVAVLFLSSFLLCLSKPAARSNALAAAMKDQGGLSLC